MALAPVWNKLASRPAFSEEPTLSHLSNEALAAQALQLPGGNNSEPEDILEFPQIHMEVLTYQESSVLHEHDV